MATTRFVIPSHLVVSKQRRNRKSSRATRKTVSPDVKAWLGECAKSHWFLSHPEHQRIKGPMTLNHLAYDDLIISFHDGKDAALFKLAWL